MKFEINNNTTKDYAIKQIQNLDFGKCKSYSFEIKKYVKKRSNLQNSSMHLYFNFISKELKNLGLTFNYSGIKGMELSLPYSPEIVKEFIWKPIQKTLYDIDSTTKLTSNQINELIDVINTFFSEKGVFIEFPSLKSLIDYNEILKNEKI